MCLAGVFGGQTSGVSASTTSVVVESAWFDPVVTRAMARRHGLNTEASFRYERGVDPAMGLAEFAAQPQEEVVHFVKALLWHAAEERRDHGAVVDDHAGA